MPSIVAANGKFYLVNSSFTYFPGIPVFESTDLVHWKYVRHALAPIPSGVNYWAPEVAEKDGRFYLFYSASTTPSVSSKILRISLAIST